MTIVPITSSLQDVIASNYFGRPLRRRVVHSLSRKRTHPPSASFLMIFHFLIFLLLKWAGDLTKLNFDETFMALDWMVLLCVDEVRFRSRC